MIINRLLIIFILSFFCFSTHAAELFSFEGFHLGMTKAEASSLHPEAAWRRVKQDASAEITTKEFTTQYLGREANVSIGLDSKEQFVSVMGFTFHAQSPSQCILDAVSARFQLEKRYGSTQVVGESVVRRANWTTGDGITIRWVDACGVGKEYFITYTNAAKKPN